MSEEDSVANEEKTEEKVAEEKEKEQNTEKDLENEGGNPEPESGIKVTDEEEEEGEDEDESSDEEPPIGMLDKPIEILYTKREKKVIYKRPILYLDISMIYKQTKFQIYLIFW